MEEDEDYPGWSEPLDDWEIAANARERERDLENRRRQERERDLAGMRRANNPENQPTGHFTGRCKACGSSDLWDDNSAYGCNKCGEFWCF